MIRILNDFGLEQGQTHGRVADTGRADTSQEVQQQSKVADEGMVDAQHHARAQGKRACMPIDEVLPASIFYPTKHRKRDGEGGAVSATKKAAALAGREGREADDYRLCTPISLQYDTRLDPNIFIGSTDSLAVSAVINLCTQRKLAYGISHVFAQLHASELHLSELQLTITDQDSAHAGAAIAASSTLKRLVLEKAHHNLANHVGISAEAFMAFFV